MPGASPQEALDDHVRPIQAVLHCVTPAKLWRRHAEANVNGVLNFEHSPHVELRRRIQDTGQRFERVNFLVMHRYRIVRYADSPESEGYRVISTGYEYTVSNYQQREILAFHWHPGQRSHEHDPHVHIGSAVIDSASSDIGKVFSRFHIPTGHVSIAQVVRLLLTDFKVVPNRQDWEATFARLLAPQV